MNSIEKYNELLKNELSYEVGIEFNNLSEEFLKEKNNKLYFCCKNKYIESLINSDMIDNALVEANRLFENKNLTTCVEEYKETLDQLVYILITKQFYLRAQEMCMLKKELIDIQDTVEVNRWYLELSYIHEALGEKNDSLRKLSSILSNNPQPEIKAVALSNITKLFIDENNTILAAKYLNECIELTEQIGDKQGMRYCEYLKARILRGQKKIVEAVKVFDKLFKNNKYFDLDIFTENVAETLNYLNEYLDVLLEQGNINLGLELCELYFSVIEEINDMQGKLTFYNNYLKIELNRIEKSKKKTKNSISTIDILSKINVLSNEINENKERRESEKNEDELNFQTKNIETSIYNKAKDAINSINFDYAEGNTRLFLINYAKSLKSKIPFDEMLVLILNKEKDTIIPTLVKEEDELIYTYHYKNDRLYERNIKFVDLIGTPVEELLGDVNEKYYKLNTLDQPVISPITREDYRENFKDLSIYPLVNSGNIFGFVFYLSKVTNLQSDFSKYTLSVATLGLGMSFVSLFNVNNNILQYNILRTCNNNTSTGIKYYNLQTKTHFLSEEAKKILGLSKNEITDDEFVKLVKDVDMDKFITRNNQISKKVPYEIDYRINNLQNEDEVILISEQASLYETINGDSYYCGMITRINPIYSKEKTKEDYLSKADFEEYLTSHQEKNFVCFAFKDDENDYEFYKKRFKDIKVSLFKVNTIVLGITNKIDIREANKIIKDCLRGNEVTCTFIYYPQIIKRTNDLEKLIQYIFNMPKKGYIEFTNEIFAGYISIISVTDLVKKSIASGTINYQYKNLLINNQHVGYFVTLLVRGVINPESINKVDNDILCQLYNVVLDELDKHENIYLLKIKDVVLLKLLKQKKNEFKNIIFDVTTTDKKFDSNSLVEIACKRELKLVVSEEFLSKIKIELLLKASKTIVGFNQSINESLLNIFNLVQKNYYYYDENGFVIDESKNNVNDDSLNDDKESVNNSANKEN